MPGPHMLSHDTRGRKYMPSYAGLCKKMLSHAALYVYRGGLLHSEMIGICCGCLIGSSRYYASVPV